MVRETFEVCCAPDTPEFKRDWQKIASLIKDALHGKVWKRAQVNEVVK